MRTYLTLFAAIAISCSGYAYAQPAQKTVGAALANEQRCEGVADQAMRNLGAPIDPTNDTEQYAHLNIVTHTLTVGSRTVVHQMQKDDCLEGLSHGIQPTLTPSDVLEHRSAPKSPPRTA